MAFHPKTTEPLEAALQRVGAAELDRAKAILSRAGGKGRAEAVHQGRKHLKKARALLKLFRFALGEEIYRRENERLRDGGRALAEVRDAQVLGEALTLLRRTSRRPPAAHEVRAARAVLVANRRDVEQRLLDRGSALRTATDAIRVVRDGVGAWRLVGDGWAVLGDGIRRTYGDGRKAFAAAYDDPTDDRFHEWRKRVKDLWHELQFVAPAWEPILGALADEAHRLGDVLGEEHDLAVLRVLLVRELGEEQVSSIGGAIDERRAGLRADAHALGARLHAEKTGAFVTRLAAYWRAWRVEG